LTTQKMADRVIETDVLVIGGGVGGCPAACKAAEHGLNVALLEKSKIERSGQAGPGLDEIGAYPRDGATVLDLVGRSPERSSDPNIRYRVIDNMLWALEELEKLGVNMRYVDGEYGWFPRGSSSSTDVGPKVQLRVHWQNVKPEMAAAVRKRGVKVFDRTMVVDLLTDNGKVAGATAVNTRTGEFMIFKAQAVVLGTGRVSRHYGPDAPPSWKYKMAYNFFAPSMAGDGHAAAYRAGAELVRMEMAGQGPFPRDAMLLQPGQFFQNDGMVGMTLNWKGDELAPHQEMTHYAEQQAKGLLPIYFSIENLPDDFQKRIEVHIADETMIRLKLAQDRGFNPGTHRYHLSLRGAGNGNILIDENLQATLKGVFAIGDCGGAGGGGGSATAGLLVGDSIHKYVNEAKEPQVDEGQVESQRQAALAPLTVKDVNEGVEPLEMEYTVRSICEEYGGAIKTEGMLREGLRRLGSLKRDFMPRLMATNPHYLGRCLEARNILDMAELHLQACLERKEARNRGWGNTFVRFDYPEEDPSLHNKRICQRLEKGKAVIEIKDVPALKPEYAKESK